jgi:hypothetical protein
MTAPDLDAIRRNVRFAISLIGISDMKNAVGTLEEVERALAEAIRANNPPANTAPVTGWSGPTTAG